MLYDAARLAGSSRWTGPMRDNIRERALPLAGRTEMSLVSIATSTSEQRMVRFNDWAVTGLVWRHHTGQ
jgi:hypothetical protein